MVVHEGILFDTPVLIASVLDATNSNCGPTINVSWTAVTGAVYQLERRVNGGVWTAVDILTGLNFSETVSPGLYEYRVRVIKGSQSVYSNTDAVTVYAQNQQLSMYCVGYDLWESYRSGCGTANRLIQALSPSCGVIYGCTDPDASNYNPNATHSNGSCVYPEIDCSSQLGVFDRNFYMGIPAGETRTFERDLPCGCCPEGSGILIGAYVNPPTGGDAIATITESTYSNGRAKIKGTIYPAKGFGG